MDPLRTDPGRERDLVRRTLAGDASARAELLELFAPIAELTVRSTLKRFGAAADPAEQEDITQEIFSSLLARDGEVLRSFEWRCSLRSRLVVHAASRTIDHLRRRRAIVSLDDPDAVPAKLREPAALSPGSPPEQAMAEEGRRRLLHALEELPARERLALRLSYWDGLEAGQIGRLLGLAPVSVRSLLSRAREHLGRVLARSSFPA